MTTHQIFRGDARNMESVPAESVEMVVTSPPYWQLKDYGHDAQIGFSDTYEGYINHLNLVWSECYRVLRPGCRLCINIGDQFARSVIYGRYKVIPIRTEITRFCETIGLDYMGAVIWQKVTTTNTSGGASIMGSFPYPRNGVLKIDYEFILLFKKPGKAEPPSPEAKTNSAMTTEEWNSYFSGHWNFPGEKGSKHLAAFPEELPRRLIRMFTFEAETVLDPFLGSGTTSVAAAKLNRNSIGFEINPKFAEIIDSRLSQQRNLFSSQRVIWKDSPLAENIEGRLKSLPYLFRDPIQLNQKVDPRKLFFGSKVYEGHRGKAENVYRISDISRDCKILTDEGLRIQMLGVRPISPLSNRSQGVLRALMEGKRIKLVFDPAVPVSGEPVLCYIYLENKTFVNRKALESGFFEIDDSIDFSKKEVFQRVAGHLKAS